ncbi:MAG: NAD(P)H-dependent oxidoreductase subunit E [Clostridia bacterium]|nr:NAD(P)H-dependent oxidoreductase subunit E [Clostridia bacterium]
MLLVKVFFRYLFIFINLKAHSCTSHFLLIVTLCKSALEEVYGVSTFYSQFVLNPKGDVSIAVCMGTACYVKGSGEILDKITQILGLPSGSTTPDGKYSLEATRCIGACGLAPVLTVNNEVYGKLGVSDVEDILAKYK